MPTAKTLLVGNFGSGNIGDEMILHTAMAKYPGSIIMTADPGFTSQFLMRDDLQMVPFFPSGIRSYWGWITSPQYRNTLKNLKGKIDKIIFPGGGLFAIKHHACFIWAQQINWMKSYFPEAEIRLEAQGVDQGLSGKAQKLTQKALQKVNKISVRDEASQEAVTAFRLPKPKIVDDPVFAYLTQKEYQKETRERWLCLLNAVNIIDQKLYSRIKKELSRYDFQFILMDPSDRKNIPLGFEGEEIIIRTHEQFTQTFANADMAIGERFHFLIAATQILGNQKTLLLREPYSEKVESFCQSQGLKIF
ncbi:MAG TPA: polysaccharide pyruvyl transferase family protein [Candidatus Gracilibacteria bacterium]